MKTNIAFIGYRTSGKTTVSQALAATLNWPRIEIDRLMESRLGMNISEMVQSRGWEAFRTYESWLIDSHLSRRATVFDLGGGAVLNRSTMRRLKKVALVVYLWCDEPVILARMSRAPWDPSRPPLTDLHPDAEIHNTLEERLPLYSKDADVTIDSGALAPSQCVETILSELSLRGFAYSEMEVS